MNFLKNEMKILVDHPSVFKIFVINVYTVTTNLTKSFETIYQNLKNNF